MGIFDFVNNVVNTVSNTVQSTFGNNNPVSQAVKTTANNISNATKAVSQVINSNPITQNAAKIVSYANPLTAPIAATTTALNTVSKVFNQSKPAQVNTPTGTTTKPITSGDYSLSYYARDARGTQYTQTWKNTQTGEINAFAADGAPVESYYAADGTLKTQNYYKAKGEAEKLAAGYTYYRGSLYSPSEMATIKASGHYDASKDEGNTAKYSVYLSNPTTFGKFVASGGTSVLNNEKANTAGYVYDSVSYDKPYAAIRSFGENKGKLSSVNSGSIQSGGTTQAITTGNPVSDFAANMHDTKISLETSALSQVFSGNINDPAGLAVGAGVMVADAALPLDLINVGNRLIRGEADSLDWSDYLMAGADLISIAAIPFTAGLSYAGVRAAKTVGKGVKIASTVGQPALQATAFGVGISEGLQE